jgi:hypothetical protein
MLPRQIIDPAGLVLAVGQSTFSKSRPLRKQFNQPGFVASNADKPGLRAPQEVCTPIVAWEMQYAAANTFWADLDSHFAAAAFSGWHRVARRSDHNHILRQLRGHRPCW